MAYSVWLLNKFGKEWHTDAFYYGHYKQVVEGNNDDSHIYAVRVFRRLFYWLGIADARLKHSAEHNLSDEFRKTDLLPLIFSFKKISV